MDIAERNGLLLRRRLRSTERFREPAMLRGSVREKTPGSRSSALLFSVTCRDHCLTLRFAICPTWPRRDLLLAARGRSASDPCGTRKVKQWSRHVTEKSNALD